MSDDGSQTDDSPETTESTTDSEADARSVDGMEELLDEAEAGLAEAGGQSNATEPEPQPLVLDELGNAPDPEAPASIEILNDVDLDLRIELGRTHMRLEDVLQLRSGSVVALDRLAGDPVDIFVNDRLVAKGEVLVLNENFCVRVTDLISGGKG